MSNPEKRNGVVWEQLLRLAESGDLRAIKLYYDMLEKQERRKNAACREDDCEMEQMAAIRQAVFGDMAEVKGDAEESDGDAETL